MTALARLAAELAPQGRRAPLRVLAASGQLGYGIPEAALRAGLARRPHFIGADMGSIDPGPAYLGSGEMATSPEMTRRDLELVLAGARALGVPLLIGSAGTAGAAPHLERTVAMLREIAAARGLRFRLATIAADIPHATLRAALRAGRVRPLGAIAPLDDAAIDASTHVVAQMGIEPFQRALAAGAEVVIGGRACDTAIFAAIPVALGYAPGDATHMAKIVECTSLCCEPGGRDAMLATLDDHGFVLESMNPARAATPLSVAAHALYEQDDPAHVEEPEGTLALDAARYTAVDARRTRVEGARWIARERPTVKLEGAGPVGTRAVLLCATADPAVIAALDTILPAVERVVRELAGARDAETITLRRYGIDGVVAWPSPPASPPREVFLLAECIAADAARARLLAATFKQHLLHHGFAGRKATAGNVAFPFTPPEIVTGTAWRFTIHHVMEIEAQAPLFPVTILDL